MDAFVLMRHYLSNSLLSDCIVKDKLLERDKRISLLEETFNNFKVKNTHIFFEGQIYDAYSLLKDIINSAKNNITIIDNYIDKTLLDILSKTEKNILIITNKYNNEDYEKYKKQYSNVKIKIFDSFHDRFFIIDNEILFHCGASFKDLGKKCFAITKIQEKNILNNLLTQIL